MRSRNRLLVTAVLAGALAASAPVASWGADDDSALKTLLAQADSRSDPGTVAVPRLGAEPGPQARARPARSTPVVDEQPRVRDTVLAAGGGLLVVVLAALGLTITFRSLRADLRGRKHRYRRRIRREPRGA